MEQRQESSRSQRGHAEAAALVQGQESAGSSSLTAAPACCIHVEREGQLQACICSDTELEDHCFLYEGVLVAEQDEGLVLDTADSRSSRTVFFPSPKQQMSCRSSCPQPASPHYSAQPGRGNRASTKRPHPWDLCQGPLDRGALQTEEPQHTANSHTRELLAGGRPLKGQKASFIFPPGAPQLHNGATDTVFTPTALNYLDERGQKQLVFGSCWAARSLAETTWSCLLPVPTALHLLQAVRHSSVFPQPRLGSSCSLSRQQN